MTREQLGIFLDSAQRWADMASMPKWDEHVDENGKTIPGTALPIGAAAWNEAIALAAIVDRTVRGLPPPELGADPLGFVWLTWEAGTHRYALAIRRSLIGARFSWTIRNELGEVTYDGSTVRALCESLRATFGETETARRQAWAA